MAGTSTSELRSAYVPEATPGVIPSTPGFKTSHAAINMKAVPSIVYGRSLISKGARMGQSYTGLDVTGSLETPLIYGVFDDFLASMLQGAWATNTLKDGKAVTTMTVENTIPAGAGGAAQMFRFRGVEASSGTLSLKARQEARLSFELQGYGTEFATGIPITGATYTDPTEVDALSSGVDAGTVVFAGNDLDCIESLDIGFGYEKRDKQPKISSDDLCGIARGDFLPTITANMYVEDNLRDIYNQTQIKHLSFAVNVPIGSLSGKKYLLTFPKCNFADGELDMSGASAMQKVNVMPQYDTVTGCVLSITRGIS